MQTQSSHNLSLCTSNFCTGPSKIVLGRYQPCAGLERGGGGGGGGWKCELNEIRWLQEEKYFKKFTDIYSQFMYLKSYKKKKEKKKKQLILLVGYKTVWERHQQSWLEMQVSGNNKYLTYGAAILNPAHRIISFAKLMPDMYSLNQSVQTVCGWCVAGEENTAIVVALLEAF